MIAELQIAVARTSDWPGLWSLLCLRGRTDEEGVAESRFERLVQLDEHCILVASSNGQLVGYAWAQDYGPHLRTGTRTARFHDIFVHPDARKHGVGAQLFAGIKAWAKQRCINWLQWQAIPEAVGFYERLGYKGDPCEDPDNPFFEIEFVAWP